MPWYKNKETGARILTEYPPSASTGEWSLDVDQSDTTGSSGGKGTASATAPPSDPWAKEGGKYLEDPYKNNYLESLSQLRAGRGSSFQNYENAKNSDYTTRSRNNLTQNLGKYLSALGEGSTRGGLGGPSQDFNGLTGQNATNMAGIAAGAETEAEQYQNEQTQSALEKYLKELNLGAGAQYGMDVDQFMRGKSLGQYNPNAGQSQSKPWWQTLLEVTGEVGAAGITKSDRRLKKNISRIGKLSNGINVYSYKYIWDDIPRIGVMADEVEKVFPNAVIEENGYKMVDYSLIGV